MRGLPMVVSAFSALVTSAAHGPVARACSPAPLTVELLAPAGGDLVPPDAVFWFQVGGYSFDGRTLAPAPEIVDLNGVRVPVSLTYPALSSGQYGPSSRSRTLRAAVQLEPNTRYELSYNRALASTPEGAPERSTYVFFTSSAGPLEPPPSPTAELAFWAQGTGGDALRFPCSDGGFNEFTIVFARAERARAIHLRSRFADETEFSGPLTHVLRGGTDRDSSYLWATDRGIPCVELVAEGFDGARSEPAVFCEPVGCGEGAEWLAGMGRDAEWWRARLGPGTCAGRTSTEDDANDGCVCVSTGSSAGGSLALLVMVGVLVVTRRPRRSGPGALLSTRRSRWTRGTHRR